MMSDVFRKRHGTTDLGKDYEDLGVIHAIQNLLTDGTIDDFRVSSNDEKFGNFDDIVIQTKSKGSTERYALQLKHSSDTKKVLRLTHLTGENGDFSLSKYLQSYNKIGDSAASCKFILLTNRKVTDWDGEDLHFKKQNFSVKIRKEEVTPFVNNSRSGGSCYRFTNIQSSTLLPEEQLQYKNFFENFYLYTNQAHLFELEERLSEEFQEKFCCTDEEFKRYKEYISKWSQREGKKEKLNKIQIKRVLAFCVLFTTIQPFVFGPIERRVKLLQEAISMFEVTMFQKDTLSKVRRIWANRKIELHGRLEEVNQFRKKYQMNFSHIKNVNTLNKKDSTKLLWLLGICPLIVTASRSAYKIIQLCNTDKFVLVGNSIDEEQLQDRSVFKSLADLNSASDVYKMITRKFNYSIHYKDECPLKSLLELNEDFKKSFSTDDLLLLSEKTLNIAGEREPLPYPYINRCLTKNIIDTSYLKTIDANTVVVIDYLCINDELRRLLRNFNLVEVNDCLLPKKSKSVNIDRINSFNVIDRNSNRTTSTSGPDLYIAQDECSREDFETLCKLKDKAERFHHFRATDDKYLEWIHSQSSIDELQPFHLEESFTNESSLYEDRNRINVVIGDPGMGKSVMMKNLKDQIPSNLWTIILYKEDICSFINGQDFKVNAFEDFLLNVKYANLKSFDNKVLKMLLQSSQVIYIWDGIDEISTSDLELITSIILEISRKGVFQWVTGRCHLKNYLKIKFNVFPQNILRFNEKQQSCYIQERLRRNPDDSNSHGEKIRNLIFDQDILEIPLQIFMLTELFLENPDKYSNLSKDLFNVTDLYGYFVDEKFNIHYKKSTRQSYKQILDDHRKKFSNYQKAAMKALLGSVYRESYDCEEFLKEIQQANDPVGIITKVTDDLTPHFIHKSFAEYLIALYFVEHYKSNPEFKTIIFNSTQQNIRFFFDLLMAKNSPAHVAVLYKNIEALRIFGDDLKHCKDLRKRNVLQIACSWGQQYPTFPVSSVDSTYIINTSKENDFPVVKEDPRYVEILRHAVDNCDESEEDELFQYTSLKYAEEVKNFFAKAIILNKRHKPIAEFSDDYSLASVLYYSAKFGYVQFIDLFKNFPFIKTEAGSTYLHLSVCQEEFVRELLNMEVYKKAINDKDANGLTALAKACRNGGLRVVQHLLNYGADANIPSKDGRTPLHHACQFGHYDIASLLLESGTNVDTQDHKLWTPLHLACSNGHLEVASLLLHKGADMKLRNHDDHTSIDLACINGHEKILDQLIFFGFEPNFHKNIQNAESLTPFHLAAWHGHVKVVVFFLRNKINSNIRAKSSKTPLHLACENGHEEVVRLLCEYGTKVNVATDEGWTPLHFASNNGYCSIAQMLIRTGSLLDVLGSQGWTPLHLAACEGHTDVAKLLLKYGADPEIATDEGRTALHYASVLGKHETVKLLIEHGCDANAADDKGSTPLHLSCEEKQDEVVKILTDSKADVNVLTKHQKTALHFACQNGYAFGVDLLLKLQADTEVADIAGETPLHIACRKGHERIVELLRMAGVGVNSTNKNGWTPLHYVSSTGNVKIAKMLLTSGANVNATIVNKGATALHVASQKGHDQIVKLLLSHGASKHTKNNKGKTALHVASKKNYYRVVWLLIQAQKDINNCDNAKWTPLHYACSQGHLEIVKLLVHYRANINAANEDGHTPLHLTCINGDSQMCEELLKYRKMIEIDAVDDDKKTPLHLACENGHKSNCHLLIAANAKVSARAEDGSTILHAACLNGKQEIVEKLLPRLQNVDVRDYKYRTPLHYVCEKGYSDIAKALIGNGASVNARDEDNKTPLHYVCEKGFGEIAKVLIAKRSDINARDKDNRTPLHNACERGHEKIVELLLRSKAEMDIETTSGKTPLQLAADHNNITIVGLLEKNLDGPCCILTW